MYRGLHTERRRVLKKVVAAANFRQKGFCAQNFNVALKFAKTGDIQPKIFYLWKTISMHEQEFLTG